MNTNMNRRRALRGMLNGVAVTVGVPFLDCFLNTNGTALASGAELPVAFGTWVQGLGFNPGFWEPKVVGKGYTNNVQFEMLNPFKDKINIFSGMKVFLDARSAMPHSTGYQVCAMGDIPTPAGSPPSLDSIVADTIGTRTRFRSIEVSCDGGVGSWSRRSATAINASEPSPVALYKRIFGPEFKDPNNASFEPDPQDMARRSVLSFVTEQRQDLVGDLGASDKARMDEYFTALRGLEQQLDLQLQKPSPMPSCTVPGNAEEAKVGADINDALANGKLHAQLLAHALACGQTRVFNVAFSGSGGGALIRIPGSTQNFHQWTHEEGIDPKLGYQPNCTWLMGKCLEGFAGMLAALDSVREGDHTLLDRIVMYYFTDNGYARLHTLDNMPLMTAGLANGRIKGGYHISATGDPVTRVGLTVMQALGVPISNWGTYSNDTSKIVTDIVA